MGKIVGSLLSICCVLYVASSFGASLSMRVVDTDGLPLAQAIVGMPFALEITAVDVNQFGQYPEVQGLQSFDVHRAGMNRVMFNGIATVKYLYTIRIDKVGSYEIGPATLLYNGTKLVADPIRLIVSNEAAKQDQKKESSLFMRLLADKEHAVVGERIGCHLRFYTGNPEISLRQFIQPALKKIRIKNIQGPVRGTEKIGDKVYDYVELTWDTYFDMPGKFVIPAYGADYDREMERDHLWGGLGWALGPRIETKRIYSNALEIKVDEIPSSHPVQAVGSFRVLRLTAQPTIAKQGEGIVLTVEIDGDGDPEAMQFNELVGMPSELKYYASKQESTGHGKRFEFIVQALEVGSWEIPPQSFFYYDVIDRKVKELRSSPISITIMPGSKVCTPTITNQHIDKSLAVEKEQNDIAMLHEGPWHITSHSYYIPWWLLLIFILLPGCVLMYRWMSTILHARAHAGYRARRAYRAFYHAQKENELLSVLNQ